MKFEDTYARTAHFRTLLGNFHGAWCTVDITLDFMLGKFLNLSHEDAQILTAGMQFGPKVTIIYDIIKKSDHKSKTKILESLNKLRNDANRNVFAHSYLISGKDDVTFIERKSGGGFQVRKWKYNRQEWEAHVKAFLDAGADLWKALDEPQVELEAFCKAALNAAES